MPNNNESTMKWKVDIAQLKSAMQDAKRAISLANAEFKNATAGLGKWSNSITGVEAKIKQLNKTNESQKTVLANLQKQYDIVAREMGEDSTEAQKLKVQIENQQAAIKKTDAQLNDYNTRLSSLQAEQKAAASPMGQLTAKIDEQEAAVADLKRQYANAIVGDNPEEAARLAREIDSLSTELAENKKQMADAEKAADELDKSIDAAGDSAKDAAEGGFTVMKGALANLMAQGISAALNGLRQLGSAVIDAGKQSLASYANYEQLVGGVDKLFQDASGDVQKYAEQAYITSGMSANQYMQQVTGFSASLINSLGGDTKRAAELGDVAMRAMSDNVNTFGSSMEDVQNAFQGFAKANFSMLDNLRLGYGGSKTEMERLIADANEYAKSMGLAGDLTIDSFADQIQAIELIQQKQNIAGTTAREAAGTMEGAVNMAKGAWENFLVGLSDDKADLGKLFDNLIESIGHVIDNWLPRIRILLDNTTQFISDKMHELFPEFMATVDPIVAFIQDTLIPAVKSVIDFILDNAPIIIAALAGIGAGLLAFNVVGIVTAAVGAFQTFFGAIKAGQGIMAAFNAVTAANPIGLVVAAIAGLVAAFAVLWNTSEDFRNFWIGLWEKIKKVAGKAIDGVVKFFKGAWDNIKKAWSGVSKFFGGIWKGIKDVFSSVGTWFKNIFSQAWTNIKAIWNAAKGFFTGIWNGIKAVFAPVISFFKTMFSNAWIVISNIWKLAVFFFQNVWNGIKAVFASVASFFSGIFQAAWNGVKAVWSVVSSWFGGVWNNIKAVFSSVGSWFSEKFTTAWNNIKSAWSGVAGWFGGIWTNIKNTFSNVGGWFKEKFTGAWNAIKGVFSGVGKFFGGIWDTIKSKFTDVGQKVGDAISGTFKAAINGLLRTAENVLNAPIRAVNSLIDKINSVPGISLSKLNTFSLPRMALGGILKRGQVGLLEGSGAEAVVPLEKNKQWIAAVARDMVEQLNVAAVKHNVGAAISKSHALPAGASTLNQYVTFNQTNNSPQALDRLAIYRDTKSLMFSAKVGLANV